MGCIPSIRFQVKLSSTAPDTQLATIAGAIANHVCGNNHDADSSFGDHVLWFDPALRDGTLKRAHASVCTAFRER
jgi:FAD/FMN-containing dehydrogenase